MLPRWAKKPNRQMAFSCARPSVPCDLFVFFCWAYFGLSPLPVTVANEGLQGSPTKNIIILVVTATGQRQSLVGLVLGDGKTTIGMGDSNNISHYKDG